MSIVINNRICDYDTEALDIIAQMLRRLTPSWQDPRGFHELKSEILGAVAQLQKIAGRDPSPLRSKLPKGGNGAAVPGATTQARVQVIQLAERVFAPPVQAPACPHGASSAYPKTVVFKRPRLRGRRFPPRRKHRYPRPPQLKVQGSLL
jgi:hypothetical protein